MTFKPNQAGINRVFQQIASKLEKVDADVRSRHTGQPVEDITEPATAAFRAIGVNLPPNDVRAYATAVSKGEPFKFKLN